MKPVLLVLGIIMSLHGFSQQVAKSIVTTKDMLIGFYQYTPADYNANPHKKYPLIIFLHGLGERGNGTTDLPRVTTHGIPKEIKNGHPMRFFWNGKWESFIVLSPQLSASYAVWQTLYVDEMLAYAKKNLRIDPNRIALTGMSLGGGGTWSFASRYQSNAEQLSSIVAVCATYKTSDMSTIANAKLPVWALHATDDGSVSVSNTHTAISRILSHNPAVQPYKTIWPTGNHGIWTRAYDTGYKWQNPNIYEWMIAQDRSLPVNIRPKANAGTDLTVSAGTPVTLSGALSTDEDGTLVRFIWSKISGPSTGTINTPVSPDGVTQVTGLGPGTYTFELKAVDDRADYTLDTISITVVSYATPNIPPVVKAGDDKIIYETRTELNGTASYDPDGTIVSYKWSLEEGPGQYTILNDKAGNTEVINLGSGTYKFRLTATDNRGATRTGIVTITEMSSVLGVEFDRVSVVSKASENILSWSTRKEKFNDFFEIQRSSDGINFEPIGKIKGKDSSVNKTAYSFEDKDPLPGIAHYRIKQVSKGKKITYSEIVKTTARISGPKLNLYPVPASDFINLHYDDLKTNGAVIRILGIDAKVRTTLIHKQRSFVNNIRIPTAQLAPGMYFVEVRLDDGRIISEKFLKR